MASAGWRTPCAPSRRTSGSSTSVNSRICRKPTAKRSWSCLPEKNCSPCWARTRPDGLDPAGTAGRWLRGLDGEAVSLVQRGTTHGVLQSTKAPPTVRPELAAPIKALIEEEPSFGYRTVAGLLDINKNTVQRLWRPDLSRNRWVIAVGRTSKE